MDSVRVTFFIQFLNSFAKTNPIVAVLIFLSLITKGSTMAKPPLMSLPIIFQLSRMFFAFLSDFLGRKLFFVLKGFLSMISSLLYYLACTPLDFLAGKITEGVGDASLWAVNRAFILEKIKIQKVLVYLRTIDYVSVAIGCLLAGFLIKLVSYRNTLMFCFLVSTVVCVASLFLIKKKE